MASNFMTRSFGDGPPVRRACRCGVRTLACGTNIWFRIFGSFVTSGKDVPAAQDDRTRTAKLDALLDRAEILDCIHRYTRGIDRHDRQLVRSAYHDGAIDEHGGFVGPVDDFLD